MYFKDDPLRYEIACPPGLKSVFLLGCFAALLFLSEPLKDAFIRALMYVDREAIAGIATGLAAIFCVFRRAGGD